MIGRTGPTGVNLTTDPFDARMRREIGQLIKLRGIS